MVFAYFMRMESDASPIGPSFKNQVIYSLVVGTIIFVVGFVFFNSGGSTPPSVEYSR